MSRRPRANRVRQLALPQLLPNLLTLGAICAGLTSLRFAIAGRFGEAVGLIILAAILDALDGRMARMMGSESAIGAELDSLADFLNFGVVTGMLVYLSMLSDIANLGWIAVLVYVVGCVLRLARFNVDARSPAPGPSLGGFIGVPSPAGAMLAMLPLFLNEALPAGTDVPDILSALWLVIVGFLLISRIPTPSLKKLKMRPEYLPYWVILLVAIIAVLFTWPWWTLIAADVAYLCVVGWSALRRLSKQGKSDHEA
ncbi:CDP-diacylglycerol--serine O-phosphatidyltransferase [Haematobacter missouriensis]|uniref:CDP-diacylglycerol--serine O-phosphatidyltransferase n=1 Tax=Haematobacter missouriensis TaxID=366616 RepID=A0A212AMX6_9RHOB|nr:phosphatidylcholine/phosphatidylserine synthase [Haematobacter missouriensis]KFI24968.1 CDP-diacylglycerol--serine O-phosphatidyltransferase [Haematobacter missouriensis]OWJ72906.1 CDP-diacylglycerol--serine O-phosphatidyltransferase [Haematobacter missouriensis]OWJ82870.1 CDP-diacylglycerol--serine O-phosphatidyltransferase [Haematobacter missouriensis]